MADDKFRVTFPIAVSLALGEQPTAQKINSIASQAKNGLALVERALGDLWNQSGSVATVDHALQIANLSRALGKQAASSAIMPLPDISGAETILVTQDLSPQDGLSIVQLNFEPADLVALDAEIQTLQNEAGATYTTNTGSRATVNDATDYYVESSTGRIFFGSPINNGQSIDYEVDATTFKSDGSTAGAFNVVPYPIEAGYSSDWNGLKFVRRAANKYFLFLPPRRPLAAKHESGKVPSDPANSASLAAASTDRYWYVPVGSWTPSTPLAGNNLTVASKKHYRYRLPDYLYDRITNSPVNGELLPAGCIFLWNNSTQTIVEGITFRIPEVVPTTYGTVTVDQTPWVLQIEGVILDNLLSGSYDSSESNDEPTDYKADFSIIVAGESAADKIGKLSELLIADDHSVNAGVRIPHSALTNLMPNYGDHRFPTTYRAGDDHPQYLSREGSDGSSSRDRLNNAMMGDLLLASTNSGTNYNNLTADSRKIIFGDYLNGPQIYWDQNPSGPLTIGFNSQDKQYTGWLQQTKVPVIINEGVLAFGTAGSSPAGTFTGIVHDGTVSASWWKFVGDNRVDTSGISTGEIYVLGDTHDISATNPGGAGNDAGWKGDLVSRWLKFASNSTDNNKILYKGGPFAITASGGANTITLDTGSALTNVIVSQRAIAFGSSALDVLQVDTGWFRFYRSGVTTSTAIEVGELYVSNNNIIFGDKTDYINYSDSTKEFTFLVDNGLGASIVRSNILRTVNGWVQFSDTPTTRIELVNTDTYTHLKSGSGANVEAASFQFRTQKTQYWNVPVIPQSMFLNNASHWAAAYVDMSTTHLNAGAIETGERGGPAVTLQRSGSGSGSSTVTMLFAIPFIFDEAHYSRGAPQVKGYHVAVQAISGGNTITIKGRMRYTAINGSGDPWSAGSTTAQTIGTFICDGGDVWSQHYISFTPQTFIELSSDIYFLELQFSSNGAASNLFKLSQIAVEVEWQGV